MSWEMVVSVCTFLDLGVGAADTSVGSTVLLGPGAANLGLFMAWISWREVGVEQWNLSHGGAVTIP